MVPALADSIIQSNILLLNHDRSQSPTVATMNSPRNLDEDKALIIEDTCCHNTQSHSKKRWSVHFHALFLLLNVIIAGITIYSNANIATCQQQVHGWDTELHDARSAIEYEERAYTGALTYDYEKHQVVKVNDGGLEFFGPPSAEINDAWHYLLHGSSQSRQNNSSLLSLIHKPRRVSCHDRG
jgi:hypothetical protein